jgi:anti-sigma regulatory factor (Ser/Thr protein kinase)
MTRLIHQVLMYDNEKDILDTVVPFLQEGLSAGEAVLTVGTAHNLSCLRQALGTDSDAVEFADSASWYVQPTRTIANYSSFIAENATARIRVVAEPGWETGTPAQISEWTRYESIINEAFADISASVLCLYDRRTTDPGLLDGALRTHPQILEGACPRCNESYLDPATITACVDRDPLPAPPPGAVRLPIDDDDLSALRSFISGHARHHGMSRPRVNDLLVAATEVATNAIRHGRRPISCQMWREDDDLIVDVTDAGRWDPDPVPGFLPPDPSSLSGFGLWGVRMLCALVQLRTGLAGTTIRLHVPCR